MRDRGGSGVPGDRVLIRDFAVLFYCEIDLFEDVAFIQYT